MDRETRDLLVGRDPGRRRRWRTAAVALFACSFGYWWVIYGDPLRTPQWHEGIWPGGYVAVLVALAAVQAYSNGGLATCWLVAGSPLASLALLFVGTYPGSALLLPVFVLVPLGAVLLGTAGFLIGETTRRIAA